MRRLIRYGARLVINPAERDTGSDPLLPAEQNSVAQKGQTPCRTEQLSAPWVATRKRQEAAGSDRKRQEATGSDRKRQEAAGSDRERQEAAGV